MDTAVGKYNYLLIIHYVGGIGIKYSGRTLIRRNDRVMNRLSCNVVNNKLYNVASGHIICMHRIFLNRELTVSESPYKSLTIKAFVPELNCQRRAAYSIGFEIGHGSRRHTYLYVYGIRPHTGESVGDCFILNYMSAQACLGRIKDIS